MDRVRTALGKILHDEIFKDEDIETEGEKSIISITEPKNEGKDGRLEKFSVVDVPIDVAVFSLDFEHLDSTDGLRKDIGERGLKYFTWLIADNHKFAGKKCDIVIVAESAGTFHVIVAELKSNYLDEEIINIKLKNSYFVIKYVFDMLQEYHVDIKSKLRYHLVVFAIAEKNLDDKLPTTQEEEIITNYIRTENYDEKKFEELIMI